MIVTEGYWMSRKMYACAGVTPKYKNYVNENVLFDIHSFEIYYNK